MDFGKGFNPGATVYFIGIKGTGMAALAEFLYNRGVIVSGSDTSETFYTDIVLKELGIPYHEGFDAQNLCKNNVVPDLVIYSDAYSFESNAEMAEARRLGLAMCRYSDALGAYSALFDSSGIAGVHGKTTLTAMAGTLMRGAQLPIQVLAGSAVKGFGNRSTLNLGKKYFIAENDEYRRHFLSFEPKRIVLTSVEPDHHDYYPDYASIRQAYLEYLRKLPDNGELIYCADDRGACETVAIFSQERPTLKLIPYGFSAQGDWGITDFISGNGQSFFKVRGFDRQFELRIPGRHSCLNAVAALALTSLLIEKEFGGWNSDIEEKVRTALTEFKGSKRRSEVIGEAGGILFMDDYAHHPTAIKTTLAGFRDFYGRRLAVSFMPHTYSRTAALLDEFAACFEHADIVILHKIYSSAREQYTGGITGRTLYEKTRALLGDRVFYVEEPEQAVDTLRDMLLHGDLFVTMGAGSNWKLGQKLFTIYTDETEIQKE